MFHNLLLPKQKEMEARVGIGLQHRLQENSTCDS